MAAPITRPALAPLASQGFYPNGGSTLVIPVPEDTYFETVPGRMRLSHDGMHWTGQFGKVLRFMLADLLDDGPAEIAVTRRTENPAQAMQRLSGTLVSVTETEIRFEDGVTVALADVLDVEF